ncbi:hypothetical protein GCM10010195_71020 [Kitasatospora griseola]|nr:hypothetical protein GCM10010195_71020 [Kitasatospora griseola]
MIGVLLLLPLIGYAVPWDADPRYLADQLQPPGVSAIERNGRSTPARDGRTDEQARNADRIRRHIRAENGGQDLRAPYAGGAPRVIPKPTQIRREIIKEIYTDRPTGPHGGPAPADLRPLREDRRRPPSRHPHATVQGRRSRRA